jgi:hypothetical protein
MKRKLSAKLSIEQSPVSSQYLPEYPTRLHVQIPSQHQTTNEFLTLNRYHLLRIAAPLDLVRSDLPFRCPSRTLMTSQYFRLILKRGLESRSLYLGRLRREYRVSLKAKACMNLTKIRILMFVLRRGVALQHFLFVLPKPPFRKSQRTIRRIEMPVPRQTSAEGSEIFPTGLHIYPRQLRRR